MADSTSTPPSSTLTTSAADDATYYTWSSFFSILTGSASQREREAYFRTKDNLHEEIDCKRCDDDKKWLFDNSPIVRFLKHNIDLLGPSDGSASMNASRVICRKCDARQSGGFDPEYGILICANQMRNRGHMEDTLAHEMVHAWDHLKWKVEANNMRHQACLEVSNSQHLQQSLLSLLTAR